MATPSGTAEINGHCDDRFAAVRREFERNFAERDDLGAAVAITLDGAPVVDLWAGWLDAERTRPWTRDAIVDVWSVGKAVTAIAALRLVDRGLVELDRPVAEYWPEFAQAGKATLPLRYLLSHEAGLPAVRRPLPPGANLLSWETMTAALAAQEPWWTPGRGHGYHANTFGFLAGEVLRRATGRRLRDVVLDEIARPLGIDFFIGFGPEHDARTADWVQPPPDREAEAARLPWLQKDPATVDGVELARILAYRNPPPLPDGRGGVNTRLWRAAEYPSTNPHSNARSLARLFGALACGGSVDGVSVLSPGMVEQAREEQASGEDLVLGRPTRFGLGFQLTIPGVRPLGPHPQSFGHYGNGALLGYADPTERIGFSYVCNRAGRSWRDPRNIALIDAMYAAL
ncbi:MAG: beta-lactamase family protein [Chloroflexi bacterium]|nr:beta-lactamase family protein [Chloroflexota bacterium]